MDDIDGHHTGSHSQAEIAAHIARVRYTVEAMKRTDLRLGILSEARYTSFLYQLFTKNLFLHQFLFLFFYTNLFFFFYAIFPFSLIYAIFNTNLFSKKIFNSNFGLKNQSFSC